MGESATDRGRGKEITVALIAAIGAIIVALIQVNGGDSGSGGEGASEPPSDVITSPETSDAGGEGDPGEDDAIEAEDPGDLDELPEESGPTSATAVIAVDPDTGPPLSKIVVTGRGFEPGEPVRIYYDRDTIDSVSALRDTEARDDGSINVEVQLPDLAGAVLPTTIRPWAEGLFSGTEADTVFMVTGCAGHVDCPAG